MTLWHALVLNASFYKETYSTRRNRRIARSVVLLAALSHMLGSAVILLINRSSLLALVLALVIDGFAIVAGYYLWTLTIWKIGQRIKVIDPTYRDLLIPIGFAYAPQVLNFLTLIPLLGRAFELVLATWSLLAVIVAVKQGLNIQNGYAILLCLVFWLPLQLAIGTIQVLQQELVKIL